VISLVTITRELIVISIMCSYVSAVDTSEVCRRQAIIITRKSWVTWVGSLMGHGS